jgi:hypothetical protein
MISRAAETMAEHSSHEVTMSNLFVCLTLSAVLLAGCAASRMPATSFADPGELERTVMRYYERHASEENQTCLTPYMDGLTKVDVVEETPQRLVLDVRYFYRDRFKDDTGDRGFGRECSGYSSRRFTLGKGAAGVEVLDMTGP